MEQSVAIDQYLRVKGRCWHRWYIQLLDHNIILWLGSQKRLLRRTQKVYSMGLGFMRGSRPAGLTSCRITPSTRTSMFFSGTLARCTRYFSSLRSLSRASAYWFSTSLPSPFTSLIQCRKGLDLLSSALWSKEAARVTAWLTFWWQRKGSLFLMGRRQVDWVLDQNLMWLKFYYEAWIIMGCSLAFCLDLGDCILYLFEPDFLLEGSWLSSFLSSSLWSTSILEKLRFSAFLFSRLTDGFLMTSVNLLLSSSICSLKILTFSWNSSFLASKAMIWSQLNLFLLKISLQSRFDFSRQLLQMSYMICWRARSIVLYRPWTSRMATFCFCFFSFSCAFSYYHTGETRSSLPTEDTLLFSTDRFFFSRLRAANTGFLSGDRAGFGLN